MVLDHGVIQNPAMTDIDKVLVIVALALGVLDMANISGPFSRFSSAGLAIVLLAIVALHQGHVLNF
jgi:hypothetical protein